MDPTQVNTDIDTDGSVYDYNDDNTAGFNLKKDLVNDFIEEEIVVETDSEMSLDEKYFSLAISMLDENFAIDGGYYPKGDAGNFLVDVVDNSIDLSNYNLPGDITGDFEVDENDMKEIIAAVINGSGETIYDVNKDNIVDKKDIVFVVARLITEAITFDFYTEVGEKIDIDTVLVKNKGIISDDKFLELEKVRVIVRDINNSGQISTQNEVISIKRNLISDYTYSDIQAIREAIKNDCFKQEPEMYLGGWLFSLEAIDIIKENGKIYSKGSAREFWQLENDFYNEVYKKYFTYYMDNYKTNFSDTKRDRRIIYMIGYTDTFETATFDVISRTISNSRATIVKQQDQTTSKVTKSIIKYGAQIVTYKADTTMHGSLDIYGWNKVNGKLRFERLGPEAPHHLPPYIATVDVIGEENAPGKYRVEGLPPGEYKIDFFVPDYPITKTVSTRFVYKGNKNIEKEQNFTLDNLITVEGYVYENSESEEGEEIALVDGEVTLRPMVKSSGVEEKTVKTDENGKYVVEDWAGGASEILLGNPSQGGGVVKLIPQNENKSATKPEDLEPPDDWGDSLFSGDETSIVNTNRDGWFDNIDFGYDFTQWIVDFIAGFFDWSGDTLSVPPIYVENTYDITMEYTDEVFKVTAKWENIEISKGSTKTSQWISDNFLYIISEEEEIIADTFTIDILDADVAEYNFARPMSADEENPDMKNSMFSIYKVAKDMVITGEDMENMVDENGDPIEWNEQYDSSQILGNYTKDYYHLEIELFWELVIPREKLSDDEYEMYKMLELLDADGNYVQPMPNFISVTLKETK